MTNHFKNMKKDEATENKIKEAYFNLFLEAIKECFKPFTYREYISEERMITIKRRRMDFANGDGVKLWCDASDNFEYNKLKNLIHKHNKI